MKHCPCLVILLQLFFTSTSVQHGFTLNSIHIEHAGLSFHRRYQFIPKINQMMHTKIVHIHIYQVPDTRFRDLSGKLLRLSETIQLKSK